MPESILVATTAVSGFRALAEGGQQVIDAERQILSAIRSRIGEAQASLFARPVRQVGGQQIAWYATGSGAVRALLDTDEAGHEAIQNRVEATLVEVRGLSQQLRQRPGRAAHLGQLLGFAARPVTPEMIYLLGDQPVLVLWGFEQDPTSAPVVAATGGAAALAQATPGSAQEVEPEAVSAQGATLSSLGVGDTPVAGRGMSWWRWLLLLLMLGVLVYLVLRALSPLAAIERVQALPPQELGKDIAAQEQRIDGLSEQFAGLQRRRDVLLEQCTAQATPAPIEAPPAKPEKHAALPVADKPKSFRPDCPAAKVVRPALTLIYDNSSSMAFPLAMPEGQIQRYLSEFMVQGAGAQILEQILRGGGRSRPVSKPDLYRWVKSAHADKIRRYGAQRTDIAKPIVARLIDDTPNGVPVELVTFSGCTEIETRQARSAGDRQALIRYVKGLPPGGGTAIAASLNRATRERTTDPRVIILLTDGAESCNQNPCASASAIAARHPTTTVHVVKLGPEQGVTCVARHTGGKVYNPRSVEELSAALQEAQITSKVPLACRD